MSVTADIAVPSSSPGLAPGSPSPGRRRSAGWSALTGALGAVSGVAPHVLHHVGPLVGAAVLTGAAGTAVFGAAGLLLSVPLLLRLRRRFGTWWAPVLGLAVFTTLFLVSSLVVGPLISEQDGQTVVPAGPEHAEHHE